MDLDLCIIYLANASTIGILTLLCVNIIAATLPH